MAASDAIARDRRILKECDELNASRTSAVHIVASYHNNMGPLSKHAHDRIHARVVFVTSDNCFGGRVELDLNIIYPRTYPNEAFCVRLRNEGTVFHPLLWNSSALDSMLATLHWKPSSTVLSHCIRPIARLLYVDAWW